MFINNEIVNEQDRNKLLSNEHIDEIVRGEIAALEAYDEIIDKLDNEFEIRRMREFKNDHKRAIDFWQKQALIENKIPERSSSMWGAVVNGYVKLAEKFGEKYAIKAILRGEKHGLKNYKKMLNSPMLSELQKIEIKNSFMPKQKKHIESMKSLLNKH